MTLTLFLSNCARGTTANSPPPLQDTAHPDGPVATDPCRGPMVLVPTLAPASLPTTVHTRGDPTPLLQHKLPDGGQGRQGDGHTQLREEGRRGSQRWRKSKMRNWEESNGNTTLEGKHWNGTPDNGPPRERTILAQSHFCSNVVLFARMTSFSLVSCALVKTWCHAAQRLVGGAGRMGADPSWSASSSGQWPQAPRRGQNKLQQHVFKKEANKSTQQHSPPPLQQPSRSPVSRLESAISVLGEDNPHTRPLQEALKVAKMQATVPPIQDRIQACKAYLERARKRVASHCQGPRAEVDLRWGGCARSG